MEKQSNSQNRASAPSNLPREDENISKKREEVRSSVNIENKADRKETAIKSLAVLGVIALILIGLYGSSRVIANLPDMARSVASGFVSVTSQFFGADEDEDDEGATDEDEDEDEDTDEEDDEDEDADEDNGGDVLDDDTTPPAPTTPTQTTRREYRVVQQPTSFGPQVSDPNGDVDLEVTILATGVWDRQRDRFVERSVLDEDDTGAVRFQVRNVGTKTSEEWRYRVDLPTDPDHTYDSSDQMELKPGERVEYTMQFDSLSESNNELTIEADPGRRIDDDRRSNNRVEVDLDIRD